MSREEQLKRNLDEAENKISLKEDMEDTAMENIIYKEYSNILRQMLMKELGMLTPTEETLENAIVRLRIAIINKVREVVEIAQFDNLPYDYIDKLMHLFNSV